MIDVSIYLVPSYQPQVAVYHSAGISECHWVELGARGRDRNNYLALYCETREAAEDLADAFQRAGCVRVVDVLNVGLTNYGR